MRDFPSFDQMEREINGKDEEVKNRPSNFIQEIANERLVKQQSGSHWKAKSIALASDHSVAQSQSKECLPADVELVDDHD